MQKTQTTLNAEIARVVESVRTTYQRANAEEDTLSEALEVQKREALGLNRRGIEYAALQREAESARLIYNTLLQRAKETGVVTRLALHQHQHRRSRRSAAASGSAPQQLHHGHVVADWDSAGCRERVPLRDAGRSPQGSRRCQRRARSEIVGTRPGSAFREQSSCARAAQRAARDGGGVSGAPDEHGGRTAGKDAEVDPDFERGSARRQEFCREQTGDCARACAVPRSAHRRGHAAPDDSRTLEHADSSRASRLFWQARPR